MIRPGLCSVTFRELDVPRVAELAAQAGLECIEWAGDVHVPPGDLDAARRAKRITEDAGLAVASYGSYLRFEGTDEEVRAEGEAVLASALALGAPRIRVWAGSAGSADVSPEQRAQLVARHAEFARHTAAEGVDLGLEFHGRTLTDEVGSTLRLLDEVGEQNVLSYWQPHQDMPDAEALRTLREVLPRTSTIHVFSWWPGHERLPLAERSALWREAFALLEEHDSEHGREPGGERDALLEFLPGDDPALLPREAATLRALLGA